MQEISLEKVDEVKKRTGVSYGEAKLALEMCGGDVLEAIIHLENDGQLKSNNLKEEVNNSSETVEEFKEWLKDLIGKGNVSRIKVKKDEKELVDVPVNAGIAAAVIAVIIPPILAFGVIAAVATKLTIEITMVDGSVRVINKYVSKATGEVKETATKFADQFKSKLKEMKKDKDETIEKVKVHTADDSVYSYTVTFDDEKE